MLQFSIDTLDKVIAFFHRAFCGFFECFFVRKMGSERSWRGRGAGGGRKIKRNLKAMAKNNDKSVAKISESVVKAGGYGFDIIDF